MKYCQKILCCIVFMVMAHQACADFKLGAQYYEQGNFKKAYDEFMLAASYGDYDAQYNLAAMYLRGQYVDKNKVASYAWMSLSEQDSDRQEQKVSAKIYAILSDNQKQQADSERAELFARYGDQALRVRMSPELTASSSVQERDYRPIKKVAPQYPRSMARRAKQGWVDVVFTVDTDGTTRDQVVLYSPDEAFTKETIKAVQQWQYEPKIIDGKPVVVTGVRNRVIFQLEGSSYKSDELREMVMESKARAEKGGAIDQFQYGYLTGNIVTFFDRVTGDERNKTLLNELYVNSNEWFERSAIQNYSPAAYFLGLNILHGNACEQDSYKSAGWLLKAASNGSLDAQYTLAIEYLSGAYFEKDIVKGLYWLERSATGFVPAKLRYAWYLSAYPDASVRDSEKAQQYLAEVDNDYWDTLTLYEVRAAVAAQNGDIKAALKWQDEALEEAEDLNLPTATFKSKLDVYAEGKPWRIDA